MSSAPENRVVIIGSGFGGLHAAKALRRAPAEVVVVDRCNHHLFQPLLYQVASGGLSGADIASPIRGILRRQKNVRVVMDEAVGFRLEERRVILRHGPDLTYDALIVAAGAGVNYFGNDEWREWAPALKTIEDANLIRQRLLSAFEEAEREPDPEVRRKLLSFVVVGAGPTGVELAGVLAEVSRDTLQGDFRRIEPRDSSIQLIDMAPRVLPGFPEELSAKAERDLVRLGVRSRTGVKVEAIDDGGVTIQTGIGEQRIPSRTVLWAAGVRANPLGGKLAKAAGVETDKAGRIPVEPDCTVPGHRNVHVIGDMAACRAPDGSLLPGLAPVAMQQGDYVGELITRRLRGDEAPGDFEFVDKGTLAAIGRLSAVADFGWLRLTGVLAWLTWLIVHLLYLVGFQNRVLVAVQWAFHYFTYNRRARIITGNCVERCVEAEESQSAAVGSAN